MVSRRTLVCIAAAAGLMAAPAAEAVAPVAKLAPLTSATVTTSSVVSQPSVEGPVMGGARTGRPYSESQVALSNGYIEREFFFSGTAEDASGNTAPYKSRILVRRPTDPNHFNGTVIVDWTNVTIPDDTDVSWIPMNQAIMNRGFVYVSVAAQRLAIEASPLALKQWDPVRYGTLSHPGDDFSFDIFSQAAEAILNPIVLGNIRDGVERRLAVGASQSGGRLKSYINGWHTKHGGLFDGYGPQISGPSGVNRNLVPILWLQSQGETGSVVEADSDLFRLMEISGPAHAPNVYSAYTNGVYVYSHTNGAVRTFDYERDGAWGYYSRPGTCVVRNYHNANFAYMAQLVALDNWVRTGVAPSFDRAARDAEGNRLYDEHGNVIGGVRDPQLDVPIATYFAGGRPESTDPCSFGANLPLTGTTAVFSASKLRELYPGTDQYLTEFLAAVDVALSKGHITSEGAEELRDRAQRANYFVETTKASVSP